MCSHCGIDFDTDIDMEEPMDNEVTVRLQRIIAETGSRQAAAVKLGISTSHLSELLRGTRNPGPAVLRALGLRKEIKYEEVT